MLQKQGVNPGSPKRSDNAIFQLRVPIDKNPELLNVNARKSGVSIKLNPEIAMIIYHVSEIPNLKMDNGRSLIPDDGTTLPSPLYVHKFSMIIFFFISTQSVTIIYYTISSEITTVLQH